MATATTPAEMANPLGAGAGGALPPQPCILVIFGAAGDLSWRKLMPAVYNLNVDGELPSNFAIVGFGIGSKGDPDEWLRSRAREGIEKFSRQPLDEGHWADFSRALFYVEGSFNDLKAYQTLKQKLDAVDAEFGIPGARVFYLAIPPQMVGPAVEQLKSAGMVASPDEATAFTRVIVEKPIGHDLESAREINGDVAKAFSERQTYRIDHYLGKETVQTLMVLRFANSIFEPLWNGKYIDHVQITVSEEEGLTQYDPTSGEPTASRIGYYEGVGALRDMVQNHMLQVLCMTAMEPPFSLDADVVRDGKFGVLRCLRPFTDEEIDGAVVRGQYIEGEVDGHHVPSYRHEVTDFFSRRNQPIPPNITTETFVAMKLYIDNWRWAGVPFYLRTGKRLAQARFESPSSSRTSRASSSNQHPDVPLEPNVLSIRIQPEEDVAADVLETLPGPKVQIYPVKMEFSYEAPSSAAGSPEAYERLILDVMAGDATLFMRRDARRRRGSSSCRSSTTGAGRGAGSSRSTRPGRGGHWRPIG